VKVQISIHKATLALTVLWGGCFALGLAVLGILFFANAITPAKIPEFLRQLSAIYAPYLGAMLVYFFATRKKKQKSPDLNRLSFHLAFVTSALWNLVVLCLLFRALEVLRDAHSDLTINSALSIARDSAACLSWIASPAIGFFFAKPSTEDN
jgi:hypothetical protein